MKKIMIIVGIALSFSTLAETSCENNSTRELQFVAEKVEVKMIQKLPAGPACIVRLDQFVVANENIMCPLYVEEVAGQEVMVNEVEICNEWKKESLASGIIQEKNGIFTLIQ